MNHSNNKKTLKISAEDFWRFSCELYSKNELYLKDGQAYSLLELQNKFNKNVNICLLMLYLDNLNISINLEILSKLISTITDFENSYLFPLRALRLRLKAQESNISLYAKMRKTLLESELLMEQHQQSQLINSLNNYETSPTKDIDNLQLYLNFNMA
ncbi:TIGR02444 family protein [Pseudoalteromonas sp. C2R02]|uniref:TIGR02444 family protein n=1 Tax=Pseudoalteromonas sp. C2R02 TaxID=2841565 RepID=UPI001C087D42|nr:TIGR02444 family protein [Pseudoalteromonas sp. C2R02]MBU2972725.1 TIGR02444 family protein [Pseudoalteromonas sp. C2R02]